LIIRKEYFFVFCIEKASCGFKNQLILKMLEKTLISYCCIQLENEFQRNKSIQFAQEYQQLHTQFSKALENVESTRITQKARNEENAIIEAKTDCQHTYLYRIIKYFLTASPINYKFWSCGSD
jgi:oligoendopeptidase F